MAAIPRTCGFGCHCKRQFRGYALAAIVAEKLQPLSPAAR